MSSNVEDSVSIKATYPGSLGISSFPFVGEACPLDSIFIMLKESTLS